MGRETTKMENFADKNVIQIRVNLKKEQNVNTFFSCATNTAKANTLYTVRHFSFLIRNKTNNNSNKYIKTVEPKLSYNKYNSN